MIFHWVWKKTGFPYLETPKTETKSTTMPKRKVRCQVENQRDLENDRLAKEIVAELDYLLKEGFLCLKNTKEPRIVLSREANI